MNAVSPQRLRHLIHLGITIIQSHLTKAPAVELITKAKKMVYGRVLGLPGQGWEKEFQTRTAPAQEQRAEIILCVKVVQMFWHQERTVRRRQIDCFTRSKSATQPGLGLRWPFLSHRPLHALAYSVFWEARFMPVASFCLVILNKIKFSDRHFRNLFVVGMGIILIFIADFFSTCVCVCVLLLCDALF